MDNDSLSFGSMEIKLNAVWEGREGILRKLRACVMASFAFIESTYWLYLYYRMSKMRAKEKKERKENTLLIF